MKNGMYQELPVELDDDENHEEPTPKKADKWTKKASSPQKKTKKPLVVAKLHSVAAKLLLIRMSDNGRRKIIVLNVLGLLYDIRELHNRREWGADLVIYYDRDLNVKIKKEPNAACFC